MANTTTIPQAPFVDFLTVAITLISAVLLIRFKVNSAWLVADGTIVGWIPYLVASTQLFLNF